VVLYYRWLTEKTIIVVSLLPVCRVELSCSGKQQIPPKILTPYQTTRRHNVKDQDQSQRHSKDPVCHTGILRTRIWV